MFFSKLGQNGGKNPNHPSNAKAGVNKIKSTKVVTTIKVEKVAKSTSLSASPRESSSASCLKSLNGSKKKAVSSSLERADHKRKARTFQDGDDNDTDDNWDLNIKRLASTPKDGTPGVIKDDRQLYIGDDGSDGSRVIQHAADLVSANDYSPIFDTLIEFTVELPFGSERYRVGRPKKDEDTDFMQELDTVLDIVAAELVPCQYSAEIKDPSMKDCILRRLRRALQAKDEYKFAASIDEYNGLMRKLRQDGAFKTKLQSLGRLPAYMTNEFLNQTYRRIVSPRTHELRDYKAFSNNVYGELLPPFVSRIFRQTGLNSKSVFVDLGSGVGNCVLQAALEVGCESWGCEIMKTASELAQLQKIELEGRLRLYGIKAGAINIRFADFVNNGEIQRVLQTADTVLVNNYAFSPELNGNLVDMFLDLKDGCKIVSLKSFVPPGHTISEYNIESPLNILAVESFQFGNDSVSWTTVGGDYYISTIDRSRLSSMMEKI